MLMGFYSRCQRVLLDLKFIVSHQDALPTTYMHTHKHDFIEIHRQKHTHTNTYIYIYIYICVCVCVCVCVWIFLFLTFRIKLNRLFVSASFIVHPLNSTNWSFDLRMERIEEGAFFFPITFGPSRKSKRKKQGFNICMYMTHHYFWSFRYRFGRRCL